VPPITRGCPYTAPPSLADQAMARWPAAGMPAAVPVLAPFPWY
jgi:hypothetical protein